MKRFLKLLRRTLIALIGMLFIVLVADYWVKKTTKDRLYQDVSSIPHRKTGLLLGTSKYVGNGWINLYYKYRIDAAIALFKAGKIDYILISGDNKTKGYNEPQMMMDDLVTAGVPAEKIVLDYAGFRTLDSILRCYHIFGEKEITVISQQFHDERALFIAHRKGIDAIGFCARDVNRYWGLRTQVREKFARVKMLIDLTFNKKAKFYGEKIKIG